MGAELSGNSFERTGEAEAKLGDDGICRGPELSEKQRHSGEKKCGKMQRLCAEMIGYDWPSEGIELNSGEEI